MTNREVMTLEKNSKAKLTIVKKHSQINKELDNYLNTNIFILNIMKNLSHLEIIIFSQD